MTSKLLASIDANLQAKLPAVAASLRPPAKQRDVAKLAKLFGGKLPADLAAWFAWHDGQKTDCFDALIPDTNWTAMTCADAAEINALFNATPKAELMQPWKPAWIPLFANGGGDHLCYDRDTGAIITWYHDDKSRPKAYASLAALIEKMAKGYVKMKKPSAVPPPAVNKWIAAKPPSAETLATLPSGTVFRFHARYPFGTLYELRIKLGRDRWIGASGRTVADAITEWNEHVANPPAKASGYYEDDHGVAYDLSTHKKGLKRGV